MECKDWPTESSKWQEPLQELQMGGVKKDN